MYYKINITYKTDYLNRIKIAHFTITQPLRKVFPLLCCDSIRDFIGTLEVRPHSYTVQYFQ